MTRIAIEFYPRPKRPAKSDGNTKLTGAATPVARVSSSLRFQLSHMLADLAVRVSRQCPTVVAGRYPVSHQWTAELRVELTTTIDGQKIRHAYPQRALRGDETLIRWLATAEDPLAVVKKHRSLMFVGRPMDETDPPADVGERGFRLRAVGSASGAGTGELNIHVQDYQPIDGIDVGELARLGGEDFSEADLPVVIPRRLLVALAEDEAQCTEPFVERGWYLLGRIGRIDDDLCVVAEDVVRAEHTEGTNTSLDWSAQTKIALVDEVDRRAEVGLHQQVVGWIHTHGPILEAEPGERASKRGAEILEALAKAKAVAGQIDYRFFSRIDVKMHRKDFGPASIALVLDAAAARKDPQDPDRCFACFATVSGVVARRGVYISDRRTSNTSPEQTKKREQPHD